MAVQTDKDKEMLKMPHAGKFDLTCWVMVSSEALDDDDGVNDWLQRAVSLVRTLPPK